MTLVRFLRSPVLFLAALLAACGSAAPGSVGAPASVSPAAAGSSATVSPKSAGSASSPAGASPAVQGSAAPIAPAKAGQIVTAYAEVVAANSPVWGAADAGLMQKRGLDTDMRLIESSLSVGALISGQVQIALVGGSASLAAAVQGGDLRVLGILTPVYPYKFEVPASIKTTSDLKGKKVGISRFGSASDIATRLGLRRVGLDPDKDVNIVQVGSTQARTAAILSGALDGGLAGVPDNLALEDRGFHALFDMAALELPAAIVGIVVTGPWLNAHRDEMQRYIDATVEAIAREKRDKAFTQDVFRKYLKLDDQRLLDAAYDYTIQRVMPALPYAKPEQFKDTVDQLAEKNPKARDYDLNKLIDSSFIKSAADRGLDKS